MHNCYMHRVKHAQQMQFPARHTGQAYSTLPTGQADRRGILLRCLLVQRLGQLIGVQEVTRWHAENARRPMVAARKWINMSLKPCGIQILNMRLWRMINTDAKKQFLFNAHHCGIYL